MPAARTASAAGVRAVAVAGDVTNNVIVTGDHATVEVRVDGDDALLARLLPFPPRTTSRPTPLKDFPSQAREHVDRSTEARQVLEAVATGGSLEISGEADVGKTFVVRHALTIAAADGALQDGIVYVFAK